MFRKFRLTVTWTLALFLLSGPTLAQTTILKNSIDEALSIRSVTIAPLVDNVSQIYGKPLTLQLRSIAEGDRQWSWKTFSDANTTPEIFEDKPEVVKSVLKKSGADALISGRLTKGPKGISIKLNLFSGTDGLLLAQETLQDYSGYEIADLRVQLESMYFKLKSHLPYSGIILSRKGNLVTVNMGTQQGLKENQDLSVIQVLKINRHPRFKFIVSSEKEIIGKIHVDKVEESLSFGTVVLERADGVIQPQMKIIPVEFVEHPMSPTDGPIGSDHPTEWVPKPAPTFGKIAMLLGLGTYKISNTLSSVGAVDGTNNFVPSLHLDGELWLTTEWFMDLELRQYVFSVPNTYPGSTPGTISVSTQETTLQGGYNFLMTDDFFGPKFQFMGGYSKMSSTVDTSSPTAYTSIAIGGLSMGLAGSFPIADDVPLTLGAKLLYFFTTAVDESPVSSGNSSKGNITTFTAFGTYRWTEHMNFRAQMDYDLFSASFSGTGSRQNSASSISHTITTLGGGIEYLF